MHKIESFDGLRGLACIAVLLCHFLTAFFPLGMNYSYPGVASVITSSHENISLINTLISMPIISFFSNGSLAVCIFFTLSGSVLSKNAINTNQTSILARINKRILRFYAPVSLSIIVSYIFFLSSQNENILAGKITGSAWLSNFWVGDIPLSELLKEILYKSLFVGSSSLNPVVWTMKIELLGSVLLMSYLYLTKNTPAWLKTINIIGLAIFMIEAFEYQSIYYALFFLGASINNAVKVKSKTLLFIVFISGLYLGTYCNAYGYININGVSFYDTKIIFNSIGSLLVVYSVHCGFATRVLSGGISKFLGRISFSLYLIHFPLLMTYSTFFYIQFGNSPFAMILNLTTTVALTIILATIFYYLVDKKNMDFLKSLQIRKDLGL